MLKEVHQGRGKMTPNEYLYLHKGMKSSENVKNEGK